MPANGTFVRVRATFIECFSVREKQPALHHVFLCLQSALLLRVDTRSFRCGYRVARTHNINCMYQHATLHVHWSVKRVIQNVHFIPSPNMTALSYRRSAFPNISRDSCGAQCNYKSETLCVPIHMPCCWFTNREQGRVGMVSSDAKPYMCETYKAVALEKLSPFGCHLDGKSNENLKCAKEK